jgi:hypothetical protein
MWYFISSYLFICGDLLKGVVGYYIYDVYVLRDVEGRIAEAYFYLLIFFWLLLLDLLLELEGLRLRFLLFPQINIIFIKFITITKIYWLYT